MKSLIANEKEFANLDAIKRHYQKLFEKQGVHSYAFTYYATHPSSRRKTKYEFASKSIESWHRYYMESGFEDTDETLRFSQQAILPMYWNVAEQLKLVKTPREKRLRQESLAFGIVDGVSVPIHGPNQDFATLTIYRLKHEKALDHSHISEWLCMAHYLYAAIRKTLRKQKQKNHKYELTTREIQCLKYTAENYLAEDIAKLLSITVRTVHFHMQNTNKKMAVKNKYQAVTKAISEGII